MSNALDEFKGVVDAGITPDDNPGLEAFVEGAGEMPAPQPLVELVKPAKKGDNVLIQIEMYLRSKYRFRYNLVSNKVEFGRIVDKDFRDMRDYDYNSLLRELKLSDLSCSISSLRQILASDFVMPYDPYQAFVKNLPDWDGQDHIGELAELENMRRDTDALKELITKSCIYVRRAYAFVHENYTRRASFAGSTNNYDLLPDMTGNRRFLCFVAENIDNNHDVNMEQVYAQAIALWVGGFQYWFDKNEMAVLERNNEAFRAVCVEEEQLTSFYEPCNEGDDGVLFMKTTDILKSLLQLSGLRSLSDQKLGRVLMSLGYKRVKKDGRYGYLLRLRKPSVPDSLLSELESMVEVQVLEEPEEIELAQRPVTRIGRVQRRQE